MVERRAANPLVRLNLFGEDIKGTGGEARTSNPTEDKGADDICMVRRFDDRRADRAGGGCPAGATAGGHRSGVRGRAAAGGTALGPANTGRGQEQSSGSRLRRARRRREHRAEGVDRCG